MEQSESKQVANKSIGLVIACWGTSYGMNLQAFATQYIVEKLGYKSEIYRTTKDTYFQAIRLDLGLPIFILKILFKRLKKRFKNRKEYPDEIHVRNNDLRVIAAQRFRDAYLHNFTPILDYNSLLDYSRKFDAILVGSDQCWLPGFSFGGKSTLFFAPKGTKRVSYSTSLAVPCYPRYCYQSSKRAWQSFDSISVREEEGRQIIKSICGNSFPVDVVVDPTYLIPKTEWEELIPFRKMEEEHYVLSFMLGNDENQLRCIRNFADNKKLKLLSILSNESNCSIDTSYSDRLIIGVGPEDFVNLVRGAEFVFTDSFHGTAFSTINHKQFFVFYRKNDDAKGKNSRNSRIDNILRMWGIRNRLIVDPFIDWSAYSFDDIDYSRVEQLIEEQRSISLEFLKKALP